MPLEKLSKVQIAKGFRILDQIKTAIKARMSNSVKAKKSNSVLKELSNQYYTVIPRNMDLNRPEVIWTEKEVYEKINDLCDLSDIELAQALQKGHEAESKKRTKKGKKAPHPVDVKYHLLNCDLDLLDKKGREFKAIETNLAASPGPCIAKLRNVWKVNRHAGGARFKAHEKETNRRLLWHGTNVAVVAAVLKSGIRIKPGHCQGFFHANDNVKINYFVRSVKKRGIMFLNEVVLGNQKEVMYGGEGWFEPPPKGFDSVIARMGAEPDPKKDINLPQEGKKVMFAQGKPVSNKGQPWHQEGNIWEDGGQSEWMIYKESQVRIRYLLEFDWKN